MLESCDGEASMGAGFQLTAIHNSAKIDQESAWLLALVIMRAISLVREKAIYSCLEISELRSWIALAETE